MEVLTPSCWAVAHCEPWVSERRSGADPREQRAAVAWPCWGLWAGTGTWLRLGAVRGALRELGCSEGAWAFVGPSGAPACWCHCHKR